MPIPVPPWVHRTMIRDHGPDSSTMRLCLFTVNAFMDEDGMCFPSQRRIAASASLGEKTVQRVIGAAIDLGWLAVESHSTPGRAWKNYVYHAAVPDTLATCAKMRERSVAEFVKSHYVSHGPLPTEGRLKRRGKRGSVTSHVPLLKPQVPSGRPVAPLFDGMEVPPYGGTKFPSEVPIEVTKEGATHPLRTAKNGYPRDEAKAPEPEGHRVNQSKPPATETPPHAATYSQRRNSAPVLKPKESRLDDAMKLLHADPHVPIANVAQMFKVTEIEVLQRRGRNCA